MQYREAKPAWHFIVPAGLAAVAGAALTWSWTMLDQHEYGVAMLLIIFFSVIGIAASLAVLNRTFKVIVVAVVLIITAFSGLKILKEKADKPWSSLMEREASSQSPTPTPLSTPTPMPKVIMPTVVGTPSPLPPPARISSRKPRRNRPSGLTEEEKWILRQLNSNKNAHAVRKPRRITREEIKKALVRKLSKQGLAFLVKQVQQRGITFLLTPEIEKEIRDFGAKHGNRSLDSLIAVIKVSGGLLKVEVPIQKPVMPTSTQQQPKEASLPKDFPTPRPRPSPRFDFFLYEYKAVHNGYNTYRVLCTSDTTPCEYFAKLGRFSSDQVRLMVYVARWWAAREVLLSVLDNYDRIIEDLKIKMKNEGMEILGLKITPIIIVYIDVDAGGAISIPWNEAEKRGLSFQIERSIA